MKSTRKKISIKVQKDLIEKYGNACCMCNNSFPIYEKHHIRFVEIGGNNEFRNLIPLCPNCHTIFTHHLGSTFDESLIRLIGDKWLYLKRKEALIISNLETDPQKAAIILLDYDTRILTLTFGKYKRMLFLANKILKRINLKKLENRLIFNQVANFAGEMSLYINLENSQKVYYKEQLEFSINMLDRSNEFKKINKWSKLTLSRMIGKTGNFSEERKFLEESRPDTIDVNSEEWLDWHFRKLAYLHKMGNYDEVLKFSKFYKDISATTVGKILLSNIMSEVARLLLKVGDAEEAKRLFYKVLEISKQAYHRRGLYLTNYYLAKTCIQIGDYAEALNHYLFACQFRDASEGIKESLEEIRFLLEQKKIL